MTVDFGALNNITPKFEFLMPYPDSAPDEFHGCVIWTAIDLANAFYQIMVHPDSTHKLAFMTKDGLWEFLVMPFSIKNAPATFQYLMYLVLGDYLNKFVFVYLDDIIIYSKSIEEHTTHVRMVLEALRKAKLKIKPTKCQWFKKRLNYLGYIISEEGISPDPTNIAKIQQMRPPHNIRQLRSFLGFCQF